MNTIAATTPDGRTFRLVWGGIKHPRTGLWSASAHEVRGGYTPQLDGVGHAYPTRAAARAACTAAMIAEGYQIGAES